MNKSDKHLATSFLTSYLPTTPYVLVYMLQQVEYSPVAFMEWGKRWPDFRHVMRRKKLVRTPKALFLLAVVYAAWLAGILVVAYMLFAKLWPLAVLIFFAIPGFVQTVLLLIVLLGLPLLKAKRAKLMRAAEAKVAGHPGIKIAVLGSYGKTTAKEILAIVLGEGKKVAVTPGNMNVAISHARWIMNKLDGTEDVVIFEYGEFRPGDIATFAKLTHPDKAVVTGYAPNHLDTYKSAEVLQLDLAAIEDYIDKDIYVAAQAASVLPFRGPVQKFDDKKVLGWAVKNAKTGFEGTQFTLEKGGKKLKLHSAILGLHVVPVLALAAALAAEMGLKPSEIEAGVAKTKPFEHRLEPRAVNGAWIIDDTYNGNIEGMRAGLELLAGLPAKRRLYVTPGLVEQGDKTQAVHAELGELIAKAKPDKVVLMKNSTTDFIEGALHKHGYKGEVQIEENPLHYYEHMNYELAAGDVVLLQNDWTDNYA